MMMMTYYKVQNYILFSKTRKKVNLRVLHSISTQHDDTLGHIKGDETEELGAGITEEL